MEGLGTRLTSVVKVLIFAPNNHAAEPAIEYPCVAKFKAVRAVRWCSIRIHEYIHTSGLLELEATLPDHVTQPRYMQPLQVWPRLGTNDLVVAGVHAMRKGETPLCF